ncbi:hypothetical protein [Lacticaseibacillus paracasei]|uniref:Uncharacterized protein n=1 Tax=Lacticaseibacillus paracasei TaxID=1597 RepID=A0AAW6ACM2_LACPA|nr:hypothetical protein [Lacticaseibacillus paracasei]MDB1566120.1 hypothetical protein [Lacticaseibacillus paracasei]
MINIQQIYKIEKSGDIHMIRKIKSRNRVITILIILFAIIMLGIFMWPKSLQQTLVNNVWNLRMSNYDQVIPIKFTDTDVYNVEQNSGQYTVSKGKLGSVKYLSNSQFELISSDSNNPNTVFTISKSDGNTISGSVQGGTTQASFKMVRVDHSLVKNP